MESYLGLDFGGTKLAIGEVSAEGTLLASKCYHTGPISLSQSADLITASLKDYLDTMPLMGTLSGVGAGIVGVVDHKRGQWVSLNHEITEDPIPLAQRLSELTGVPGAIDNDVRSATTAELLFGNGRSCRDFIYVNVGTGLAAGIVANGRILRGAHNNSGEVGHMCLDLQDRTDCICGRHGCAENVVSGVGFARQYAALHDQYPTTRVRPDADGRIDARELFALAGAGDPLAVRMTEHGAEVLANLIMNLVRMSDPEIVVLGGGIVADGWLLAKLKTYLVDSCMRYVRDIVLSALDPHKVGLIGAASLGLCRAKGMEV